MSHAVNLLLLLSALLSALTGVGGAARAPQAAVAVAQAVERRSAAEIEQATSVQRPVATLPSLAAVAFATGAPLRLPAPAPLFLSRRRE